MEALEFLAEAQRMCKSYPYCTGCPSERSACGFIRRAMDYSDADIRCAIKVVEQWSKDHPIMTNAHKFKEVFGLEPESDRCPPFATNDYCTGQKCIDCKSWWDEPYEEPEHED